nr:hypothetical protein [Paracoccus saliphilus]
MAHDPGGPASPRPECHHGGTYSSIEGRRRWTGAAVTGRRISRLILLSGTWLAAASLIFLPLIEMATDIILSPLWLL